MRLGIDLDSAAISANRLLIALSTFPSSVEFLFFSSSRLEVEKENFIHIPTADPIFHSENPLYAIRKKKESSLIKAIFYLKEKKIDALLSAGNTGAYHAACSLFLPKFIKEKHHVALAALLPKKENFFVAVDVGANLPPCGEKLLTFAQYGWAIHQIYYKNRKSHIGLLNIGEEKTKGTQDRKIAYRLLKDWSEGKTHIDFIGNIEPHEVFFSNSDVLVCDGFSGNIFLKTAEGSSRFFAMSIENIDLPDHFMMRLPFQGALFCGIDALAIKIHGSADHRDFIEAIKNIVTLIENNFIDRFKKNFSKASS